MLSADHVSGGRCTARVRRIFPWVLALTLAGAAWATPPPDREAQVGVAVDLTHPGEPDTVSIRIVGNTDQQLVGGIAVAVAMKLNTVASEIHPSAIDRNFVGDAGVGVDVRLPVMSRANDGLLPLTPFIEAIAPHAATLRIAYIITGPFEYRGYDHFEDHPDVSFVVDPPKSVGGANTPGAPTTAMYGVRVTMKNQILTAPLPTYPPPAQPAPSPRRWPTLLLVVGAVVLGCAVLGTAGVLLLPRLKAWAAAGADRAKGDPDDRKRQ